MQVSAQTKSRFTMAITFGLFLLPTLTATLLFMSGWRSGGTVNHGELITPPVPVENVRLVTLDGKSLNFSDIANKWTMMYFDTADCRESCVSQIFFMRQIHHSQGKDLNRIQRIFVLLDDKNISQLKDRLKEYPDMLVVKADKTELASLKRQFDIPEEKENPRNIYFVDPYGNLMMRYQPGVEPKGMRKDLERLLKYSGENR